MINLILFENDTDGASRHLRAGITSFMIDTETLGKDARQLGFGTDISPGTFSDLGRISSIPGGTTWCRLNRYGDHSRAEVDRAIDAGSDVVLLPMSKSLAEVEAFLGLIANRASPAIMIETVEAAALAPELGSLPIKYAFFGLNDFTISRGGGSIFNALVDGSVERVRNALPEIEFGVAGLTDISKGHPIPSAYLLEELERLQCSFTFLRRSFRRDSVHRSAEKIVEEIQAYWQACSSRKPLDRENDHKKLSLAVQRLPT